MEGPRETPPRPGDRQASIIFEITQRCNLGCRYCYNVWKNHPGYPRGELDTAAAKGLLSKVIRESGCRLVTLSGGEPLLRPDLVEIAGHLRAEGMAVNLITNGTLLGEGAVRALVAAGVRTFELPLLSWRREVHNRLVGAEAFDRVTEAFADIKLAGGLAVAVFIATEENIADFEETAALAFVLGVDGIMFNRFNPGGEGARHIEELLPSPGRLAEALGIADGVVEKYGIPVASSIAIPPCIVDTSRFRRVAFGTCAAGTSRAYYTMDSLGNVRMCNHTPAILGNLLERSFGELTAQPAVGDFVGAAPAFCRGCSLERRCQGGCKAAAESSYGDLRAEEPFLRRNRHLARRPA